jgi:small subunit ribosomal protein S20
MADGLRLHSGGYALANTSSALKRMRQNERRRLRNRTVRSKVRTAVKTARTALGGADARTAVGDAIRALDKAVTKGVIHRNTAARKKSALARRLAAAK